MQKDYSKVILGLLITILTIIIGLNIGFLSTIHKFNNNLGLDMVEVDKGIKINGFIIESMESKIINEDSAELKVDIDINTNFDKSNSYYAYFEYWTKGNENEKKCTSKKEIKKFPFLFTEIIDDLNYDEDYEYMLVLNDSSFSDIKNFSTKPLEGLFVLEMYNSDRKPDESIRPRFKLSNISGKLADIKNVKIRYYYTVDEIENGENHIMFFDRAIYRTESGGINIKDKLKADFISLEEDRDKADYYLEISFDDTICDLEPDSYIELWTRFSKERYSEFFDHTGDYSYSPGEDNFKVWNKVTMYIGERKIFGKEPAHILKMD